MNINKELIKARVMGFTTEAGAIIVLIVLKLLVSPEFLEVVTEHFGTGLLGSIILLLLSGGVKHLLNLKTLEKAKERFGRIEDSEEPIILI